jgi:hypothetical protein
MVQIKETAFDGWMDSGLLCCFEMRGAEITQDYYHGGCLWERRW